jgi:hypothetical protein
MKNWNMGFWSELKEIVPSSEQDHQLTIPIDKSLIAFNCLEVFGLAWKVTKISKNFDDEN